MSPGRRVAPEEALERELRVLFTAVGIDVQKVSQGFRGHFDSVSRKVLPDRGGTRQTRGLADLELWIPTGVVLLGQPIRQLPPTFEYSMSELLPPSLVIGKWETKTPKGLQDFEALRGRTLQDIQRNAPSRYTEWRHVQEQLAYAARCWLAGIPYGRGGIAEAYAFLEWLGLAEYQGEQRGQPPRLIRAKGDALQRLAEVAVRV